MGGCGRVPCVWRLRRASPLPVGTPAQGREFDVILFMVIITPTFHSTPQMLEL
jgi:hypothetical protein